MTLNIARAKGRVPGDFDEIFLQGRTAPFSGPDTNCFLHRHYKDLTVPDLSGAGRVLDSFQDQVYFFIIRHDFDLDLGKKIDFIFCAAVDFLMSFLTTEAHYLTDRHTLNIDLVQCVPDLFQPEGFDYGLYFFHFNIPFHVTTFLFRPSGQNHEIGVGVSAMLAEVQSLAFFLFGNPETDYQVNQFEHDETGGKGPDERSADSQ